MKQSIRTALLAAGIVIGTVAGVNIIYKLYDNWQQNRALVNRTEVTVPALRGDIVDADGVTLATSRIVFDAHLDCTVCKDSAVWAAKAGGLAASLAGFLPGRDSTEWAGLLGEGRRKGIMYLSIARGLTEEELSVLRTFPLFDSHPYRGGGIVSRHPVRVYPNGRLGCRAIGLFNENHGASGGLESICDDLLRGEDGKTLVLTGRYEGRPIRKEKVIVPVSDGLTVHSSLSLRALSEADSLLRETLAADGGVDGGCLVLMEAGGAVRVMANVSRDRDTGELREWENHAVQNVLDTRSVASRLVPSADAGDLLENALGKTTSPLSVLALYNGLIHGGNWAVPQLAGSVSDMGKAVRPLDVVHSSPVAVPAPATLRSLMRLPVRKDPGTMTIPTGEEGAAEHVARVYLGAFPWKGSECSILCAYYGESAAPDTDAARRTAEALSQVLNR